MIFVDSNVPMYLVGSEHPHKIDAQRLSFDSGFDDYPGIIRLGVLR